MDIFSSKGKAKHFAGRVASLYRILSDITWPVVAYTTVRTTMLLAVCIDI